MELDSCIYIVMHSVLSLKPGVADTHHGEAAQQEVVQQ